MPFRTQEASITVGGVKVADGDDAGAVLVVNKSATVKVKAFGKAQKDADNVAFADPGLTIDPLGAMEFVLPSANDELWLSAESGTVTVEVALA